MGKLILINGGVRSGKSNFAVNLAKSMPGKVGFIAACEINDPEMKKRVALHKKARPKNWKTIEHPESISSCIKNKGADFNVIILDCLGMFVAGKLWKKNTQDVILKEIKEFIANLRKKNLTAIIVTNETGMGIVPEYKIARDFRDILGTANQLIAKEADEVIFMFMGIPLKIKNKKPKIKNTNNY